MTHELPHIFQTIISHDGLRSALTAGPVVDFKAFRTWSEYRTQLHRAAKSFITKQRGGKQ